MIIAAGRLHGQPRGPGRRFYPAPLATVGEYFGSDGLPRLQTPKPLSDPLFKEISSAEP
jgi:hypothetical protein